MFSISLHQLALNLNGIASRAEDLSPLMRVEQLKGMSESLRPKLGERRKVGTEQSARIGKPPSQPVRRKPLQGNRSSVLWEDRATPRYGAIQRIVLPAQRGMGSPNPLLTPPEQRIVDYLFKGSF